MSLVTRCPACGTTFKVVRDQLRISDGWVRCGRCSEVFDATLALQEAPHSIPDSGPPAPIGASATPPSPSLPKQHAAAPPSENAVVDMEETDFLDDEHEHEHEHESQPAEPQVDAPATPEARRKPEPLPFAGIVTDEPWPQASNSIVEPDSHVVPPYPSFPPFPDIDLNLAAASSVGGGALRADSARPESKTASATPADEDAANVQLQKALRRARAKSAKIARAKARGEERAARESAPVVLAASEPEPVPETARRLPRFAAAAEGASFWERTGVRRALVAMAAAAALLLVLQVLHQERDLIAARQPSLRPVLAALCGLTGCEVSALRQIGDITIDGASFAREKTGDAYRLNFTLRNAAPVPLAMPAVELSLLDTQERAVVRRVLLPSEFGAPSVLPARAERAASLPLALSGPEASALPPVAGFHLLAFYP
ncbi:DUF3426 domain-containing protein [Variovorax soli]|uniref:Zn finger-like uncharacterized protein n=1 Tax=Variovorax soli TaxID=376815 RepID=A0ABU1NCE5_9BURK|nr:DUF3426 domain-containing protein [Variovorax soli]MDR6536124.1 putative Zn finger-like uncharacterized protein [Variovorax soli]